MTGVCAPTAGEGHVVADCNPGLNNEVCVTVLGTHGALASCSLLRTANSQGLDCGIECATNKAAGFVVNLYCDAVVVLRPTLASTLVAAADWGMDLLTQVGFPNVNDAARGQPDDVSCGGPDPFRECVMVVCCDTVVGLDADAELASPCR